MIAKAKVISHGANAIRYSVDKDKAEIVKTNLLPDDISPMAMWARMLALQKKFEDKLNRYHPLKRNMIRIEVSPTSEKMQGWTIEDWQRLAEVVQPLVGDETRTRMNCLGRIAAL